MTVYRLPEIQPDSSSRSRLPTIEEVGSLPLEAIPSLLVQLSALAMAAAARWATAPTVGGRSSASDVSDQLTAGEVAELLNAKAGWIYRHQQALGGTKLDGILRFSRRRVSAYLERQHRLSTT